MDQRLPDRHPSESPANGQVQELPAGNYRSRSSSFMTCALVGCLLAGIVLTLISLAGVTVAKGFFTRFADIVDVLDIFGPRERETEVGLPTIEEIRALSQLETVEIDFSNAVKVINRRGTWPVQSDEVLIYNVCGRATAGIDLEKLEKQDVRINKETIGDTITYTITITLPQAEVLAVNPADDTSSIDSALKVPAIPEYPLEEDKKAELLLACNDDIVWDVPPGFDRDTSLIRDAEEQAMIQFRAFAEKEYVLELAQQNAKRELERFLKLAGYQEVSFCEVPE